MIKALRPPSASLFAQLLILIVISLVASFTINTLVIFNLPPPLPDVYRVGEVVQVLRGTSKPIGAPRRPLMLHVAKAPPFNQPPFFRRTYDLLRGDLAQQLGVSSEDVVFSPKSPRFADRDVFRIVHEQIIKNGFPANERVIFTPFKVGLRRRDGQWLIVEPKPSILPTPWQQRTILWFALSTLALSPFVYLFARRLAAPMALFAAAAERLGRDPGATPLAISGPTEIGVAVRAFNDMQERLQRYVEDRTAMIGAIAHDLRTPLTRMRFRLESLPEDIKGKLADDIGEMETMIGGVMAFVRDATRQTARTRLELSSLVESLADDMTDTGANVAVQSADRVVIDGDPVALRRLVNNLLENAVKFGGSARARVFANRACAVIEIDDDGPGLPQGELERVFEPFYRHEGSRSRDTGGIGLGLAVVRSIARAHGGDVILLNRVGGGLTARAQLPL